MKLTALNEDIPDWLRPYMRQFCDCNVGVMCDDGFIDENGVMKLTQRWCSNPQCPYHMAEKISKLAEYFHVTGVGAKTALEDINTYKFKIHLDALKLWFHDKPEVYLYEAAELSYVYGLGGKCKEWLSGYESYEEYFTKANVIPDIIYSNREYLEECAEYFHIKSGTSGSIPVKIMITGSIKGFRSREEFLNGINEIFKGTFFVIDNKKTVRDTICLVKESDSVDYSKTNIAITNGIPIVTSEEFILLLQNMREELVK